MRGKQKVICELAESERSIPAYAGETGWNGFADPSPAVDPRVCGGNACEVAPVAEDEGRSPRMRGKLIAAVGVGLGARSIPAYAGETRRLRRCGLLVEV